MGTFNFKKVKKKARIECPIYLWGAGSGGRCAFRELTKLSKNVSGFVDSNESLEGMVMENRPVFKPASLIPMKGKILVIISSIHIKGITQSLEKMGFIQWQDYISIQDYLFQNKPDVHYSSEHYVNTSLSTLNRMQNVKDAFILNIGSGTFLGVEIALILAGAKQVVSMDILDMGYPDITEIKERYEDFINLLLENKEFREKYAVENIQKKLVSLFHESDEGICFNTNLIKFHNKSSECIPAPDCYFDFVFSNSVMEHLANPEKVIKDIIRVLKYKAVSYHQIDLRDHRNFDKPFEHLYMSRLEWNEKQEPFDFCSGNQFRGIEFKQWFEQQGCTIESYTRNMILNDGCEPIDISDVHSDFKHIDQDELGAVDCFILVEKV